MIELIPGLPANVIGYTIVGHPEPEDYRILHPELGELATRLRGGVNLLVDTTAAHGLCTRELWETAAREWQLKGPVSRLGLIGNPLWAEPFERLAQLLNLAESVATFAPEQRQEAIAWLTGVLAHR